MNQYSMGSNCSYRYIQHTSVNKQITTHAFRCITSNSAFQLEEERDLSILISPTKQPQ